MTRLIVTTRGGRCLELEGGTGHSVMAVIRSAGVEELTAMCDGCCSCGTCHVFVNQEDLAGLPPMGAAEDDLLDSSEYRCGVSRLACQIRLSPEIVLVRVTIAPEDWPT